MGQHRLIVHLFSALLITLLAVTATNYLTTTELPATEGSSVKFASGQPRALWRSENGDVLLNGKVFHMKGVNWFGLDATGANLLGLNKRSMNSLLDWMKAEKINAIRVPLSVQWSLNLKHIPDNQGFTKADYDLANKPWITILEKLIVESGKRGIVIMLDMHTIGAGDNLKTKRWYNQTYDTCDFRQAWHNILNQVGYHWNIMGLDLKNELHDVTWGTAKYKKEEAIYCTKKDASLNGHKGDPTDWKQEVEVLIEELDITRKNRFGKTFTFNGLYIVQGMHIGKIGKRSFPYRLKRNYGYWFGGNLEGIKEYPLTIAKERENKIAYTTHVYGPSVYPQEYYDKLLAYRYPENLASVFEQQNSHVEELTGRALIIGEWGGRNKILTSSDPKKSGKNDKIILDAIAKWFSENCIADAFWWAINPESGDTGGLFESTNYQKVIGHKMNQMKQMMPYPTVVTVSNGRVRFIEKGEFNEVCLAKKAEKAEK